MLAFLHEHAQGYDERFIFNRERLTKGLGTSIEQIQRDSSFISAHGLVVVKTMGPVVNAGLPHLVGIWLTGDGENMMRTIESEMEDQLLAAPEYSDSIGARITTKTMGTLWDSAQGVVVAIVSKWVETKMGM